MASSAETSFKEVASLEGLTDDTISILILNGCDTLGTIRSLRSQDIKRLDLNIGQNAVLTRWSETLNSELDELRSSDGNSVDQVRYAMAALQCDSSSSETMSDTDCTSRSDDLTSSWGTRQSQSKTTPTERRTRLGTSKKSYTRQMHKRCMEKAIKEVLANGTAVNKWDTFLRKLPGITDGDVVSLKISTCKEPQKCLDEGIRQWMSMGHANNVDRLMEVLDDCDLGGVADDIEKMIDPPVSTSDTLYDTT